MSAELAQHYKPDREVYETAAKLLELLGSKLPLLRVHLNGGQVTPQTQLQMVILT